MKNRDELIAILKAKYPKMFLKTTEEFFGGTGGGGGIWLSGENGDLATDKHRLFKYYAEVSHRYTFGIHKEINNLFKKHGWWAEWYDAGTLMVWSK